LGAFSGGKISGAIRTPVVKEISIQSKADNEYLSIDKNLNLKDDSNTTLYIRNKFLLYDNEDGTYSIMSLFDKNYLSYGSDQKLTGTKDKITGDTEKFGLYYVDGYYCILSFANQKYLSVPTNSSGSISHDVHKPWEKQNRKISRFKIEYLK
jgi:hypothetical protein